MEGEAARFIIQGTEMSITVAKESAKSLVQAIAFFRALAEKEKLFGEVSRKGMLKTGEQLSIVTIPQDRMSEFILRAKYYGLPYHSVDVPENGTCDIMIKKSDTEKFNTIMDRIGVVRDNVSDLKVEDVRESVKEKLKSYASKDIKGMEKQLEGLTVGVKEIPGKEV
jgi:hypothetical protein